MGTMSAMNILLQKNIQRNEPSSIGKFVKYLLIYFLTLSHLKFADK